MINYLSNDIKFIGSSLYGGERNLLFAAIQFFTIITQFICWEQSPKTANGRTF